MSLENNDKKEEIMVIENYDLIHEKIRNASYWHFIFTNNNIPLDKIQDLFSPRITKKFKQELSSLLSVSESDLIIKNYLLEDADNGDFFMRVDDFPSLIKD